jgi:hypothetical protein
MHYMKSQNCSPAHWLPVILAGLMGGCSSGAHSTASRPPEPGPPPITISPPEPNPPIYLAQVTCWDTVSCCVQRHPFTAVQNCGADPAKVASILKTFEMLYETAHPGAQEAAEADVAEVEQAEDWASIDGLPEWKQRCIKFWNTCKNKGWTGSCTDCLRYCEGQHEWPTHMCGPRAR